MFRKAKEEMSIEDNLKTREKQLKKLTDVMKYYNDKAKKYPSDPHEYESKRQEKFNNTAKKNYKKAEEEMREDDKRHSIIIYQQAVVKRLHQMFLRGDAINKNSFINSFKKDFINSESDEKIITTIFNKNSTLLKFLNNMPELEEIN
ncbi:MAG: hypothetical protein JO131_04265, partial [Gammaproteobacteria bacterium]|nr:hypothetical protein [Gammaproteobacteria bacterium]